MDTNSTSLTYPIGEQPAHLIAHLYAHAAKRKHSHSSIRRDIWRGHGHEYDADTDLTPQPFDRQPAEQPAGL